MTTFPIVEETEEQPQIETRNAQCEAQRVAYTRPQACELEHCCLYVK